MAKPSLVIVVFVNLNVDLIWSNPAGAKLLDAANQAGGCSPVGYFRETLFNDVFHCSGYGWEASGGGVSLRILPVSPFPPTEPTLANRPPGLFVFRLSHVSWITAFRADWHLNHNSCSRRHGPSRDFKFQSFTLFFVPVFWVRGHPPWPLGV